MKIVIDIPEETANAIKDNAMFGVIPDEILCDVTSAIVNGTPLPKGHGRIGDFDIAEKWLEHGYILDDVPALLEADKEGAEE
jgi:hypothetical protein